jgi:propanol-preferring alcohol dehydrogenase
MNDWHFPKMSELGIKCAGHEGAGVIFKVGGAVQKYKVGQRAAYGPIQSVCHTCEYCMSGRETYCLEAVFTGALCDGGSYGICARGMINDFRLLQAILSPA